MTVNAAWNIWNFRRPLVTALLAAGHKVTVLAPEDDSVEKIVSLGCSFVPLSMTAEGLNPIEGFRLIRQFKAAFKRYQPDVVLSFTIKNNIFGAIAARAMKLPCIVNVTGLGTAFLSGSLMRYAAEALYRYAFVSAGVVFFQNKEDRDLFVARRLVSMSQTGLLPGSGIDLEHFTGSAMPIDKSAPTFLMVSRVLRDKGVNEFVEAARRTKLRFPRARFLLLGALGSQNRTAIDEKTVSTWVDEGAIEYLGSTSDVRPFILESCCVVLPSYREGAPRTLIEGASMGRPLIATDVPGCRAVVEANVTGFLCDVRSADSLYEAMGRFLELSPEARTAMGKAGRAKMEREYDKDLILTAYTRALNNIRRRV